MSHKLKIGWFSFTCCEDSSIVLTELLNEHFFEWKKVIDFRHVRILQTTNSLDDLDVAFVEGAISSNKQHKELEEIRENCKKLVAIGSCACTGMPSGNRNNFPQEVLEKYKDIFDRFEYSHKVQKLEDVTAVDDKINSCPMRGEEFVEKVNQLLVEFGIVDKAAETSTSEVTTQSEDTINPKPDIRSN